MNKIYSIEYYYYHYIEDSFWYSDNNENGIYLLESKTKKHAENNCLEIIQKWLIDQKLISDKEKVVIINIKELQ